MSEYQLNNAIQNNQWEQAEQIIEEMYQEIMCSNFADILKRKIRQGLTANDIIRFHEHYPNRSIIYLFGFLSDSKNNIHTLFSGVTV